MARKVFFSFHYQRDAWRVSQVRNSDVVTRRFEPSRFLDRAAWEEVQRRGKRAIQDWIDSNLRGTSVTVVLIGAETNEREWVHYEIKKSWAEGKGLLGITIHNLKNQYGETDREGSNPFASYVLYSNGTIAHKSEVPYMEWLNAMIGWGESRRLSDVIDTHDWLYNNGRVNLGDWIEEAAKNRGR